MKRSVVVFVCLAVSCGRVRDHDGSAPEAGASTGGARSVSSTGGRSAAGGAPSNGGAITVQDAGRTSIPDASVPLADSGLDSGPPVVDQDAAAALHVVSVHAGMRHNCAVLDSGQVACWGANATGQLGDGTTTERDTPFVVPGITDAVDVQAGGMHSCALRATERCSAGARPA